MSPPRARRRRVRRSGSRLARACGSADRSPARVGRASSVVRRGPSVGRCASRSVARLNFHTSSTHTPAVDIYKTKQVASTTSATKQIAGSRSHGFPLSLRLNGLRPAGHFLYTTHTRTPPTRTSPGRGRGAPASGRANALPPAASLRCGGGVGRVGSSCPPPLWGWGRTAPP